MSQLTKETELVNQVLVETMSEKPSERDTRPIQVDKNIVNQIKTIVAHTGESISEYVSPILRGKVSQDYERVLREQLKQIEQERKQKPPRD